MAMVRYNNLGPTFTRLGISNTFPGAEQAIFADEIRRVIPNIVSWEYSAEHDILIVYTDGLVSTELGKVNEYVTDG